MINLSATERTEAHKTAADMGIDYLSAYTVDLMIDDCADLAEDLVEFIGLFIRRCEESLTESRADGHWSQNY